MTFIIFVKGFKCISKTTKTVIIKINAKSQALCASTVPKDDPAISVNNRKIRMETSKRLDLSEWDKNILYVLCIKDWWKIKILIMYYVFRLINEFFLETTFFKIVSWKPPDYRYTYSIRSNQDYCNYFSSYCCWTNRTNRKIWKHLNDFISNHVTLKIK